MIDVILDTNVFISGIFWSGPPCVILNAWRKRRIKLIYSAEIFDEYIRISNSITQKYKEIEVFPFLDLLAVYGEIHTPVRLHSKVTSDPDDDKFIACALGSNYPLIVSGDKDLLNVSGFGGIEILKPIVFVKKFL